MIKLSHEDIKELKNILEKEIEEQSEVTKLKIKVGGLDDEIKKLCDERDKIVDRISELGGYNYNISPSIKFIYDLKNKLAKEEMEENNE